MTCCSFYFLFFPEVDEILSSVLFFCIYVFLLSVLNKSDSQNLSVQLTLRPTSAIGVLFALVHQDRVPLSIALADYNPNTDEWRDVSTLKIKLCIDVILFCLMVNLTFSVYSVCSSISRWRHRRQLSRPPVWWWESWNPGDHLRQPNAAAGGRAVWT